jgi:hypothetical protein
MSSEESLNSFGDSIESAARENKVDGLVCSTALEASCSWPGPISADMVSLLRTHGAGASLAPLVAAWDGNVEALRVALDEVGGELCGIGAIPEVYNPDCARKEDWGTALHGVAAKGEMACVGFPLSGGARTDTQNGARLTPDRSAEHFGQRMCEIPQGLNQRGNCIRDDGEGLRRRVLVVHNIMTCIKFLCKKGTRHLHLRALLLEFFINQLSCF